MISDRHEPSVNSGIDRTQFLRLAAFSAAVLIMPSVAAAEDSNAGRDAILNDPEAPIGGNPNGDLSIVDFFDYNCPYCKAAAKNLEKVVKADGNVRIVYRDWPILHATSIIGARLALAAKYQGKYLPVHHALLDIPGYGIAQEQMLAATRSAGVDAVQLDSDLRTHSDDIAQLIKRNLIVAEAIGLRGTPGFLVGRYRVSEALTEEGFVQVVADARTRQKAK